MGASSANAATTGDHSTTPAETGLPALEQALAILRSRATPFARAPIADKVGWLREISSRFRELGPRLVAAAGEAKGVPLGSPLEGEEWFAALVPIFRNLKQLAESLEQVRRAGAPSIDPGRISFTPRGQVAVETIPHEWYDGLVYAPFRSKTWLRPDIDATDLPQAQAGFYRRSDPEGRVVLVLGAGNVASIPVLNVI